MNIEGFEQWFKLNRNLSTPISDWNRTTTELCRRIAQQNLEIVEENFSLWSDQIKRLSNVRRPEEFISLQNDCINENVNATVGNLQKIAQLSMKNFEEFSKLCVSVHEPIVKKSVNIVKSVSKPRKKKSK